MRGEKEKEGWKGAEERSRSRGEGEEESWRRGRGSEKRIGGDDRRIGEEEMRGGGDERRIGRGESRRGGDDRRKTSNHITILSFKLTNHFIILSFYYLIIIKSNHSIIHLIICFRI